MPNKIKRYKRSVAASRRVHVSSSRKGASVKALLERIPGVAFTRIADQSAAQSRWREWLEKRLPAALAARISGVVERDEILTIFTESAAWSARARYAMAELEPLLREEFPGLREVTVKVMPRA